MEYFKKVNQHISDMTVKSPCYRDIDSHNNVKSKAIKRYKPRGKVFDRMQKLSKTTNW